MLRTWVLPYRRWLPLTVGLLAGVLALQVQVDAGRSIPVAVLTRDLPLYALITSADVEVREVPAALVHPEAIGDVDLPVGRFLLRPAAAGEPLLLRYLQSSDGSGFPAAALAGDRWLSLLSVPDDGVSYQGWEPGDRLALLHVSEPRETGRREARLLMNGLEVLEASLGEGGGERLLVPLTERQADLIAYAGASGRLYFLRAGLGAVSAGLVEGGLTGSALDGLFEGEIPDE